MKYSFPKKEFTETRSQSQEEETSGMFSSWWKSMCCCFNFRRVYSSAMTDPNNDTPYYANDRDVFYVNNSPIQPLFVYG
ncbi:hypothetical protein B9Z55_023287 [Caenorhabditis nigoni]|uniref:Uncharacterized protein n=1 Tax=Caenorhabditis nigoni TaxID=1611254 RepID=A0A2G5SPI7_9PELO|nr:hypothetical protein B9Z55_023287 [Caenorhabditis nigoni]